MEDLLRLEGYYSASLEEIDGVLYVDAALREQILLTSIGHGVDLSTFERDLREGSFW